MSRLNNTQSCWLLLTKSNDTTNIISAYCSYAQAATALTETAQQLAAAADEKYMTIDPIPIDPTALPPWHSAPIGSYVLDIGVDEYRLSVVSEKIVPGWVRNSTEKMLTLHTTISIAKLSIVGVPGLTEIDQLTSANLKLRSEYVALEYEHNRVISQHSTLEQAYNTALDACSNAEMRLAAMERHARDLKEQLYPIRSYNQVNVNTPVPVDTPVVPKPVMSMRSFDSVVAELRRVLDARAVSPDI